MNTILIVGVVAAIAAGGGVAAGAVMAMPMMMDGGMMGHSGSMMEDMDAMHEDCKRHMAEHQDEAAPESPSTMPRAAA